jgi:NAD(P)-dependent dehydrogenase (short-subunit alcohol dehydrogenase family)
VTERTGSKLRAKSSQPLHEDDIEANMKIIVIGSNGTIGKAVVAALQGKHQVIGAHRKGEPQVDIEDAASIERLFSHVQDVDAVVSCAGNGAFKPLAELTDEDFAFSLRNKLMGQVNLARIALKHLRDGGSITLSSGILAEKPMPGGAAYSLVNAGLEGFVRAAALEAPRKIRVNVVSPPWVRETMVALKMDPSPGLPARDVATSYVAAVEGTATGQTFHPGK